MFPACLLLPPLRSREALGEEVHPSINSTSTNSGKARDQPQTECWEGMSTQS